MFCDPDIFSLKKIGQNKAWKKIDVSFSCFVVNTEGHLLCVLKFLNMFSHMRTAGCHICNAGNHRCNRNFS